MIGFRDGAVIALLVVVAGLAGCANAGKNPSIPGTKREEPPLSANRISREINPDAAGKTPAPQNSGDLFKLPSYEVRESAFSDFGMSVRTNMEVKWGASVEWMLVIGVDAGSSAAKLNLSVGDRILAIGGRLVAELSRDEMLAALFQRKKGERVEFLVLGVRQSLPRFVTLTANRVS
ncbi:MAG TPA: PDZ domain-containing protein [Opitutaceae bacterium]|nr:PDZ domain-containing protein [Opitutaceae bacterium]